MNRKKNQNFVTCLALASLCIINLSFAQSLPFKHYSIEQGLASSSINCIFQDSLGYLWFGTQHGLSRFDGIEFENFYAKDGLGNDGILALWEDQPGNLWIGTTGGLIRKNPRGWKAFTIDNGLVCNHVFSITGDHDGNLWIGTSSGISKFDGKHFVNYTKENSLIDDYILDITIDQQGNPWFATQKGVACFINNGFLHYTIDNGLINNKINTLMTDQKGKIWIGTVGGLSCYHQQSGIFISYTTKNGLANNTVKSIIEDKNGNIWIGTAGGLSFFSGGTFTNFYIKNGLLNDSIISLFEGKEGNIWLGTSMGVSRLHSLRFLDFTIHNGLPNNLIWAIIEEKQGKYWIGTDNGLSCYSRGEFKNYTTRDGLINNSVYSLLKDRKGKIWIATGGGISVYWAGTFTNYTVDDGLLHHVVLSLEEDREGVIWIGTLEGLCWFNKGKITVSPFNKTSTPIHALLQDSKGNIWFSDSHMLHKISGKKTTSYPPRDATRDGLIHRKIHSLFEDSRGRIWIATQQGLSCLHHGEFLHYTTAEGLSDDACYFILEDLHRDLWIGTGKGIDRIDQLNGKSFKNYTSRDGLTSSEMSKNACLRDSSGYLWFGTAYGLNRFNPALDRLNDVPPPVYINGFNVLGSDYSISHDILLKYNQNHLQISFIGLCFTSPGDVVYKYRLEGIDRYWSETKNRSISYSSLRPGEYTFKVIAKNNDGLESLIPAEIRFTIQPPFWQTWWFMVVLFILFLLAAAMMVIGYVRKEKKKVTDEARKKQLMMAQRMELMGVIAGGAVHDLRSLLSIIIGYSKMAVEMEEEMEAEEKDEALEIIKSTATTAIQLVQQILSFARQQYNQITAANLPELVDEILDILKVILPPKIKIKWEPPKEDVWLYINPIQFKQVVMNLSINAIQAMGEQKEKGELNISIAKNQVNQIILNVSDTGPGIPRKILEKIFDPLFTTKDPQKGTGLGLFVVKQIVEENGAKIQVRSQPGQGTTFEITFPPPKDPALPK